VGILADLDGHDRYSISNRAPSQRTFVRGQAFAEVGGMGLLLDRGAGNDSFLLRGAPALSETAEGELQAGEVFVEGGGFAILGASAVFVDGGGTDAMGIVAESAAIQPDDDRPMAHPRPNAWGRGFGWAKGQSGALALTGEGPTTWSISARSWAPEVHDAYGANVEGFGYGAYTSVAALHDRGGDDRYLGHADARAQREIQVPSSCDCGAVHATASGGPAYASGQGVGSLQGGAGILRDDAGDDRYAFDATSEARAAVSDHRTRAGSLQPGKPGSTASATSGYAYSLVQGAGFLESEGVVHDLRGDDRYESRILATAEAAATAPEGEFPVEALAVAGDATSRAQAYGGSLGGNGDLLDEAGDDRYETTASSRSDAAASAPGSPEPPLSASSSGEAFSRGQAYGDLAGTGRLIDLAGTDAYVSTNASTAGAEPGTATSGPASSPVQAAVIRMGATLPGAALLLDQDGGRTDTFLSIPAHPTCLGERGGETWRDCGYGAGIGTNR
ncbi:MAG: hypothetical protein M3245_01885, partial [Actinomycetota bacterium]|nr:hypothetical protein [Actinomycetota bacterium]